MNTTKLRELLTEALSLLDADPAAELSSSPATNAAEDRPPEIELRGKVGRPEYSEPQGIALWDAGLKITDDNGAPRWINIQAWRKSAVWAKDNLPSAAEALAVGRWKTETWVGEDGATRTREVFVASHFKPVYDAN